MRIPVKRLQAAGLGLGLTDLLADIVGGMIPVVVECYIDVDADTDSAEDAPATSPYVIISDAHPYTVRVKDNQYYRTLRGKGYVNDLRSEQAFKSDVTERVLDAFAADGIESPKVPAGVGLGGRRPVRRPDGARTRRFRIRPGKDRF